MSNLRIGILLVVFTGLGAGIIMRFFSLQVTEASLYYTRRADVYSDKDNTIRRGDIYIQDREGKLFLAAGTSQFLRLYALPLKIDLSSRKEIAQKLFSFLEIPEKELVKKLSQEDDSYEVLAERLPLEKDEIVKGMVGEYLHHGLEIERYDDRVYPYNELASHVLGFVGFEEGKRKGVYGIERFYEDELARGADLLLTLDITLQERAQRFLSDLLERWKSPSGSIIIMRPKDGAILAMASKPDFDPNNYNETQDLDYFLNPVVQKVFEPGSIMKPITIGGGLETGKIAPTTMYVDEGFVEKSGYTIRNAGNRIFGKRTVQEVLSLSINTGAVFVQDAMGKDNFLRTLEDFGLGQATEVDLPGEVVGDITNLDSGRAINYATASFGQGIAATPLQVISALSAIANQGMLMRPYVTASILYPEGKEKKILPKEKKRVISSKTASQMTAMMVKAVDEGYSKKAGVPGFLIAGKTGTAQIPDPQGGYLTDTIHSFIGFGPAFDPAFSMLIKLDKPTGTPFASESIAPFFSEFAQYILQYYHILPEDKI